MKTVRSLLWLGFWVSPEGPYVKILFLERQHWEIFTKEINIY